MLTSYIIEVLLILLSLICFLIAIVFLTLWERQLMASIQRRLGPDYVSEFGLIQPLMDGLKAVLKEVTIPRKAEDSFFKFAPLFTLTISLLSVLILPIEENAINIIVNFLLLIGLCSAGVFGIIFAGWESYSRYAILGSMRAIAQTIAYEVYLILGLLPIIYVIGSVNIEVIENFQEHTFILAIPFGPLALIYFITTLVETNRSPFDLTEAEAELVAGYNTEYSGLLFALYFLAEYGFMIVLSHINVLVFWGGDSNMPFDFEKDWKDYNNFFIYLIFWIFHFFFGFLGNFIDIIRILFGDLITKVLINLWFYIGIRAVTPRIRFDHLMQFGWQIILPFQLGLLWFYTGFFTI